MLTRYHGALLGLAAGDALGTTLEFKRPGRFTRIDDMIGGGDFELEPGQWTDDTSMAMCLAESLVERGFDPADQMQRYLRWWEDGYWSSNGRCFDIGSTIAGALRRFQDTGDPMSGSTDPEAKANGSLMRLAPVALRYAGNPREAVRLGAESSKTTHGARAPVDACRYFAGLMVGALQGRDKSEILAPAFAPAGVDWSAEPLDSDIARIAAGSFKTKGTHEIRASGFVVHTLEAALWAFFHSSDFREGALLAVNLGEDADTTGAVYGQLAGAHYGVDGIPQNWRDMIARRDEIVSLATALFERAHAVDEGEAR
jgi:ADP-ribosyl-[dinitrogen reductase] hydrolase